MIRKRPVFFFVALACVSGWVERALAEPEGVLLRSGDRVVFLGDSITEQRLYTRFVQQYVYCRYPELDIKFHNSGWSGNAATDGAIRVIGDVLPHNPTLVLICFGMNDGMYGPVTPAILDRYRNGMEGILRVLKTKQIRAVILTPGCVDGDRRPPLAKVDYNKTLEAIAGVSKEVAEKHGCPWIDLFHPMLALQTKLKAANANYTFLPDGVHPNPAGHLVMAELILAGLRTEPMPTVGQADLRAKTAQGMTVLEADENNALLETADRTAGPFWFDRANADIVRDTNMIARVGSRLTLAGLADGQYAVTLDGFEVGRYSAAELADGVPLPGSSSVLGQGIAEMIERKEDNYYAAWRKTRIGLPAIPGDARQRLYTAMLSTDDAYHDAIRLSSSKPVKSRIVVSRPTPLGTNLARGKSYVCSDNGTALWMGGLTDGSWNAEPSKTFGTGVLPELPKHVTIDLENAATIEWVVVGVPAFGATKTIEVWLSDDGQKFEKVASHEFANARIDRRCLRIAPTRARYVRLLYPDRYEQAGSGADPRACFTVEAEVYAAEPAAQR